MTRKREREKPSRLGEGGESSDYVALLFFLHDGGGDEDEARGKRFTYDVGG